ncbi:Bifunctional protein GlmU [Sulfuracidifex tepidarius]|uniref:Bifunctional protein GlmU n=1 Tax=Sulfuracidifex tepidarius TaxID=1294262 RepID=A0A510DW57_9CREN|nr:bifunctional sugar-1-phosphate nucleotidylyltransferase/acetyltransferase [Sulfuracidifex tepidarius]BBG24425.1 Bifunctional protein GlmU [Sulfuracidifex tepidarius]
MKAVLLAAGKGERLHPITETRPKPLVPILDKPLLLWHVENLQRVADELYVVVRSQDKEMVSSLLNGYNVHVIEQKDGIGGTATAFSSLPTMEDFILVYGDVFYNPSLLQKLANFDNAIVGKEVNNPSEFGVLSINDSFLLSIIEKPENPPSRLINAGIYKLSKQIFYYVDKISPSSRGEMEFTDVVNTAVKDGLKMEVIKYDDFWIDIGKPWHVIEANRLALERIETRIDGEIENNVIIKGKVVIEKGAVVKSGTYIEGPVYIGKNSVIGPHSYLREGTVMGSGTKAGASVEIKGSVIMEGTKVPHLSYVGDSVICEDVNLGAGTLIANLRFDENDVKMSIKGKMETSGRKKLGTIIGGHARTGINVTILPGVKIGSYARIYPGAIVNRDVQKGEFFKPWP